MQNQKVTIGININDVIRDFSRKFIQVYDHHFGGEVNEAFIIYDNELQGEEFEGIEIANKQTQRSTIDVNQFNPYFLGNYFLSPEEANDFLFESVFEIYGVADECYKNCMLELNRIYEVLLEEGFELIIISDEIGKARSATLHFLSKILCQIPTIKFVNKEDYFKHCDYLVTTDLFRINFKYVDSGDGQTMVNVTDTSKYIKVERFYNENIKNELTIKEVNELPKILNKLVK